MQNFPNELVAEISKSLSLQDLKSFASTSQEYKALLDKVIKEVQEIDKYIKETYYIKVTIREDRNVAYRFYIYNTRDAIDFCRFKHNFNRKLFDSCFSHLAPQVIMETNEHDSESDKDVPVKKEEIDFQTFLNLVTSSFLDEIKSCHDFLVSEIVDYHDNLIVVNEYKKDIDKVLDYYAKTNNIDTTISLLKEATNCINFTNCSMQRIMKYESQSHKFKAL